MKRTNLFLNDPKNLTGFSQVLEELPAVDATPTVTYTIGSQVLSQETNGVVSHLMADGHGSTRLLTDSGGAISERYSYDAFGLPVDFSPGVLNPPQTKILYAGEQFDAGLQQYYLRARYYNPTVGRFAAKDQLDGNSREPLTLHKYAFCGNNPVNNGDPSGNEFTLISLSIATAIGTTLETTYDYTVSKIGDMLQTESEQAIEALEHIENDSAKSDVATIIVHGVEGVAFKGGHKFGWSQPFQNDLSTTLNPASPPLNHDFYEFNWGGFSLNMDGPVVVGFITVKSVHQMASVHLRIAQLTLWMKGYDKMNVISHSWGTTLGYDLLSGGGIEMNDWVTMGSPLDHDIEKPIWNTGKWINAFSTRDPVTYLNMYPHSLIDSSWCPVFLPQPANSPFNPPGVDFPINSTSGGGLPIIKNVQEHGAYWKHPRVLNGIRTNLQ